MLNRMGMYCTSRGLSRAQRQIQATLMPTLEKDTPGTTHTMSHHRSRTSPRRRMRTHQLRASSSKWPRMTSYTLTLKTFWSLMMHLNLLTLSETSPLPSAKTHCYAVHTSR
ncbi:hypothetical protein TRAPUB_4096, partial [Trametes pubescens]